MSALDWGVVTLYLIASLTLGVYLSRRGSRSMADFFVSGRSLPWWLAGTSMAATTFSIDTPLYVAGVVALQGIAGNWQWWSFAISHVLLVYVFARLWRRAEVITNAELTEIRYGGRPAAVLRAGRAFIFAVPINVIAMGYAMLAARKVVVELGIGEVVPPGLPGDENLWAVVAIAIFTLVYAGLAGLWGVVATDFVQFFLALFGAILVAVIAIVDVGGLASLQDQLIERGLADRLTMVPVSDVAGLTFTTFLAYIGVQWWAFRRSDGGGEFIQRLSASRDEAEAERAAWFFNILNYVVRTWPWVMVALAALILYPDALEPGGDPEASYPRLMLDYLPAGVLGLVVASLVAAFMSTVSTQINWGASYIANDLYQRFVHAAASQRELVWVGRIASVVLTVLAAWVAFNAESVATIFTFIIAIGTGPGAVLILRWFWWRINAWAELASMVAGLVIALLLYVPTLDWSGAGILAGPLTAVAAVAAPIAAAGPAGVLTVTALGTALVWITVMLLTAPERDDVLDRFYLRARPGGPGWRRQRERTGVAPAQDLSRDLWSTLFGIGVIFGAMFALGGALLLRWATAVAALAVAVASGILLRLTRRRVIFGTAFVAVGLTAACGAGREAPRRPAPSAEAVEPALPPIPYRDGPLAIDVVYPEAGAQIAVRDSTFVFGSTGTGDASLTINGTRVPVQPNGAFLAFLPVPPDGRYRFAAWTADESDALVLNVGVPAPEPVLPREFAVILEESVYPRGAWVAAPDERIEVGFRGTPGGTAWLELPDGRRVPLIQATPEAELDPGAAFVRAPVPPSGPPRGVAEYRGFFQATALSAADGEVPLPTLVDPAVDPANAGLAGAPAMRREGVRAGDAAGPAAGPATLALAIGTDTARLALPLNLALLDPARPRVGVTRDPSEPQRAAGGRVRGLPGPGTVYHYFWPDGTPLAITGEREGHYRVRLTEDLSAWVAAGELRLLPAGTPPPAGNVGLVRMTPRTGWVDVRFALDERLPFLVEQEERAIVVTLFGGTAGTDWLQYGGLDPLVERAEWSQPRDDEYRFTLHLTETAWGYHAFWLGKDLIVRVRRPPAIDPERPLRGLLIALDPGHPPAGAKGPTRLTEPEANLAVALRLREMLEDAGARVLMTHTDLEPLGLYERTRLATEADAHVFVSIHNNAFPDGVDPFENNGTSTYYFFDPSVDLARSLQRALLGELRLRDLGIGRGDLAAVRHAWMPAALTETMFLMIPRQEAALRNPAVQERIARAHLRGLVEFLRSRARR